MTSGILRCRTASRIASRANSSKARRSASERHGILRLLACFEHAQPAALLDAVVHLAPKTQEILGGGDQGADDHEPKEYRRQRLHGWMPCSQDHNGNGADLEDHLGLTESRGFDGEALGGGNVAQPQDGEFAANDNYHHPCWNKRSAVDSPHIHEGDKSSADQ